MYDSILVPTDGSAGADAAARHALTLARAFDSQIHVLNVVDERTYTSGLTAVDPGVTAHREAAEQRGTEAVEAIADRLGVPDLDVQTAVVEGIPHETIRAYAAEEDVDLISMGTHGRTGLGRVLLGSVTERVVRTSDVPVLTSRLEPAEAADYERILVPTDGSEPAIAALDHAIAIADRFDATVHAVSVINTDALRSGAEAGPGTSGMRQNWESMCDRALATVERECDGHDLTVVSSVLEGTPSRAINDYVEDQDIDLVTMGTHGRTGLDRLLLGSLTERTVRTSDAPVLTVR
jgi:nucleotide-binding universal stress UspA family protein